MAEAVVSSAVERLKDLLISEATFLYGVKDKILEIQGQLREMQKFLKDADNRRGNQEIGKWVAEIRELALQTEDVLETYAVKVASRREGGHVKEILQRYACIVGECLWRFGCIIGESITLHEIGSEIGTIQDKITNLATKRETLGIQALHDHHVESSKAEEERKRQLRISYAHLIEKDFVGMEEEIEELVSHLKNKDKGYEVVSVWGMGGQGKTTLAQKLYNHPDVRSHFQAFAWVCITQKLERRNVLQDILQELVLAKRVKLSCAEIREMRDAELVRLLYETQKELNCLVVIDDIWSIDDWNLLKPAFPVEETSGSKILLTTRNEEVANIGFPYKLAPLSDEDGWKLLLKKAFPVRDDAAERVESKKEKLGRDMVQQCQGLPLAISILGGILKKKNSLREWEMVNKDIGSNLNRGEDGRVRHILGLSYDDLPIHLKQLFLYLGTFKEDEEIESDMLYLLWIAEGMIPLDKKANGEMHMDVAEWYLVELAQRSLVQLEPMDEKVWGDDLPAPWLKFRSCRLHDLIRDLCLLKGKEEDFLKKIDFRDAHNNDAYIGIVTRRLAIYMYDDTDNLDKIALKQQQMVGQLRSLLFFGAQFLEKRKIDLKDFKLVRVLKLDSFKFTKGELSRGITELIHLRYLSLENCELEGLPECIGDLRYLETLDLRVFGDLIIPDVLWKLKRLKHLYLPDLIGNINKKLRFDGLKELELLWNFDANKCDANDLMKLTNLQVLKATVNTRKLPEGVKNFVNSDLHHPRYTSFEIEGDYYDLIQLLQYENLTELIIFGGYKDNYMIPQPYEQTRPSQSLTRIALINCNIGAEEMVLLEKLPNLQRLELHFIFFVDNNEFVCSANSFPQLIRLRLSSVHNLEKWRVDKGAMLNLSTLLIWGCEKLEMLPEGLKFLTSLRDLGIWGMPKAFDDRVRVVDGVEGQDFHKVRHIPNIYIR